MKIVISAIALRSGGTLSVLQDCLHALSHEKYSTWSVIAIVCNANLIKVDSPHIQLIEIDGSRSYLSRVYYEYIYFNKLSMRINPDVWLSLHDMTPNVKARCRAVYCHNPSPFFKFSYRDFLMDPVFGLFTLFYRYVYRINIRRNQFVIVQQEWLRKNFSRLFKLDYAKIVVAHPRVSYASINNVPPAHTTFIYPALPRVFKNHEVLCEAVKILNSRQKRQFEVVLTLKGDENAYAKKIYAAYGQVENLSFIGLQSRDAIFEFYGKASCLVFPSLLETWGLPISEFKQTGKPIILADLAYANETLGAYDQALFFNPYDALSLANQMEALMDGRAKFSKTESESMISPASEGWEELFSILSSGVK